MAVFATKSYEGSFPTLSTFNRAKKLFLDWKSAADPCSFIHFGRDVPSTVPIGHDFDELRHVHLAPVNRYGIPEDPRAFALWENRFYDASEQQRCRGRTSDYLLYYAIHGGNYLLIAQDSHAVFKPSSFKVMCETADRWVAWMKKP
jgi:hypothetical protein